MRLRDLGILILATVGILLSFQGSSDLSLKKSFSYDLDTAQYANAHYPSDSEKLPPALVTDINGDGVNDVILVTRDPKLVILDTSAQTKTSAAGVGSLPIKKSASLLATVRVTAGKHPVALASGYLEKYKEGVKRNQVIVVVTHGWTVLCYDHNLKLLWETPIQESFPSGHYPKEVSVLIAPNSIRKDDVGMVVVGGRMEIDKNAESFIEPKLKKQKRDPNNSEEDDDEDSDIHGQETHFSYYALDGKEGNIRWKHEAKDFRGMHSHDAFVVPQHNYKLEVPQNLAHAGEGDWKEFRDQMLAVLPHRWESREDTTFRLAHFERQRKSSTHEKRDADTGERYAFYSYVANSLWGNYLWIAPDHHTHQSLDTNIVGNVLTDLFSTSAQDTDFKANVLVADISNGVEIVHLYTGRPLCALTLAEGAHADINRDGIVDHAEAIAGQSAAMRPRNNELRIPHCFALVTSGIPPTDQLFNGSICHSGGPLDHLWLKGVNPDDQTSEHDTKIQSAMPLIIRRSSNDPSRPHMDVIYLVNNGKITSYNQEGQLLWQITSAARWTSTLAHSEEAVHMIDFLKTSFVPSLSVYKLHPRVEEELVLAVGEWGMNLIHAANGDVLSYTKLKDPPVGKPVVGDFNNDGWNDVIITSRNSYTGYVLERRAGSVLLSALVGVLLVALAVIFVSQLAVQPQAAKGKAPLKRSTD